MGAHRAVQLGPRNRLWVLAAVVLIVVGTIGSILGAMAMARNESQRSHQAFVTSSQEIAATLELNIQHEQDLVVSSGAVMVRDPDVSQSSLLQWTSSVRAFKRYPEVLGIAELVVVPKSQLSAFAARAVSDPAGPLAANGTFQVTPVGNRPYYCLATASQSRTGRSTTAAGFDFCATELGGPLLRARDSGQGAYVPYGSGTSEVLVLGTPVYRGGGTPSTIRARRAAFLGWTGTSIEPQMLLTAALRNHPATAVAFHFHGRGSAVTFGAGTAQPGSQSATIDLHNGWYVVVTGGPAGSGGFAGESGILLLLGGVTLSALLAVVIFLLGTGRSRAVLLVNERTEQLRYQAFHDSLTGLPNRALILDRMASMLARAHRDSTPVATLFLDIDNFKDINDTLGHDVGDQLLRGVAARLADTVREADTVGRLGGDEFVVLVEGRSLTSGADAVADRMLRAFHDPIPMAVGAPLSVTASIGVATGDQGTPEELLRDADIALYRAKSAGKNQISVFTPPMKKAVDDHRHLDVDLHRAFEAGELFLVYQPIVELSSGAVKGVEALLRWEHPERGVVQPNDFIPALESSGLIVPVGKWVLLEACRQGASWQRQGHRLSVSVNVAAAQLGRDEIVNDVHDALSGSGFDPTLLVLELTETTLMHDVLASSARLKRLKGIGVRIAIDDFGTGYSSMAYLQQLPIDVLKIDGAFVTDVGRTAESGALVHTLVQLGKALGIATTAECIENHNQRAWLRSEGVDYGQGYLFARPLPADEVIPLVDRTAGRTKALTSAR